MGEFCLAAGAPQEKTQDTVGSGVRVSREKRTRDVDVASQRKAQGIKVGGGFFESEEKMTWDGAANQEGSFSPVDMRQLGKKKSPI